MDWDSPLCSFNCIEEESLSKKQASAISGKSEGKCSAAYNLQSISACAKKVWSYGLVHKTRDNLPSILMVYNLPAPPVLCVFGIVAFKSIGENLFRQLKHTFCHTF